ncbi:MAG: SRPBCC domain-containing protein [Actinomycetota bacterium]|nr:SRPBCC domain-containing protein [Actinomycetota bacterium]
MTETVNETITIEQTVRIEASPETVWAFWTEPQRLAEWWGAGAEVETVPGGLFRVVMDNGPVMCGTFTELDPPHRLVFTFGWEHNAPGEPLAPGSTRVEVTLTPDHGATVLLLRHCGMPATDAPDHQTGWTYLVAERLVAAISAASTA